MKRDFWLLGIGVAVGLFVGAVVAGWVSNFSTFVTRTAPETRDTLQVFNELNDLRQQLNLLNDERKEKEQEKEKQKDAAARLAASTDILDALPKITAPRAEAPAAKSNDPFAEVDEEIRRLEQTQKVLNLILDKLTTKKQPAKEQPAKDR